MYFRCTVEDRGGEFRQSTGGLYEAVTSDGELDATDHGLTKRSDVPEVCCSKSPEAALLGAVQNRQATGTYYVYETRGDPDVDMSGASARDFAVLEEVRFRSDSFPVRFVRHAIVELPRVAVTDVQAAYGQGGGNMSTKEIADVKRNLSQLLSTGQYPSD